MAKRKDALLKIFEFLPALWKITNNKQCEIVLTKSITNAYGECRSNEEACQIAINPDKVKTPEKLFETLIHEFLHEICFCYLPKHQLTEAQCHRLDRAMIKFIVLNKKILLDLIHRLEQL